ncbi:MAG: hypothetical protein K0S47_566 [Herbinix sp.]|jgi:hypothetical protein|nr:hypothetical protein [Herbinix sp.]
MEAKIKFNSYLKMMVRSMWRDGKIVEVNSIPGFGSDQEVIALAKLIVELVMTTNYFKTESKAVLQGVPYRNSGDASVNSNTRKSRAVFDFSRLKKALSEDFFERLLYKQDMDISSYTAKIKKLIEENNSKKSILDTVAIKLTKGSGREINSIEEKDWGLLLYVITNYSKQYMYRIEKKVTEEMIDYVEYLENHTDSLNEKQQEHYEILKRINTTSDFSKEK